MSNFSFIVDSIRYSYSTLSGYETCPYSFKLSKIDAVEQVNNFYGQYGSFLHLCFEKYFSGQLESYELSDFYKENYDTKVQAALPDFQAQLAGRYFDEGLLYFDFFGFDRADYDVVLVEDSLEFEFLNSQFIAKPDLVLRDKHHDREYILVDYKTGTALKPNGKLNEEKVAGWRKQIYIYSFALRTCRNITPSSLQIWLPRNDRKLVSIYDPVEEEKSVEWMKDVITRIREDNEFKAVPENKYFCNNLCGSRENCEFRK